MLRADKPLTAVEIATGSVALSLFTTAHPLHTRFANTFGTSISQTTMRPNPKIATGRGVIYLQAALFHSGSPYIYKSLSPYIYKAERPAGK